MTPLFWARAKLQLTFLHAFSTVPTCQGTFFLALLCGWIGSLNQLLIIRAKRYLFTLFMRLICSLLETYDDNRILVRCFYFWNNGRNYNEISKVEIHNAIKSFFDGHGA
jgi:hypothetical protein